MFIALSSKCLQRFSNRHAPFNYILKPLRHGVGLRVEPQLICFEQFLSPDTQELLPPQTIFFLDKAAEKIKKKKMGIHPKKDNNPGLCAIIIFPVT